ncbi:MAG: hypothetical protein HOV79_21950 [Hamadaea sp.]|nr:hypothetical protein [Hamadaea sp.]
MDLTPYVDRVRRELLVAADAAGDEGRVVAERLVAPLDSAIRLTLLSALSTAADEITRELAPGVVDVRLRGTDPTFVVTPVPAETWAEEHPGATVTPPIAALPAADDEGVTARINFRPPEHLKTRIEEAAGREGLSVNAWLVRAVSSVLGTARAERRPSSSAQSYTGWVR